MNPKQKYQKIIDRIKKIERPIVFINGLTHGDEKVGKVVIDEIKKVKVEKGTIITNIANEQAFKKGVRYIEHDINRSAPGNKNGSYEEQVAHYLSLVAEMVDVFIDIHSTESAIRDALIFTKNSKHNKKIIDVVSPKLVLIMKATKKSAPLAYAKCGIAFEYGNDSDPVATKKIIQDINKILYSYKMISRQISKSKNKTAVFVIKKFFNKSKGDILSKKIKNLKLVKKGCVVAVDSNKKAILAKEDFYPILFSQSGYESIFGFMGLKL